MTDPEAFLLLSLPSASLTVPGSTQTGVLLLECVTMPIPSGLAPPNSSDRGVYLVLRMGTLEIPIDPIRVIQRADGPGWRTYTFCRTEFDPTEMVVQVWPPTSAGVSPQISEDLDTFEGILAQYADLRGIPTSPLPPTTPAPPTTHTSFGPDLTEVHRELRGHVVMVNEDTGEVIGQLDDKMRIREDPNLNYQARGNGPVIIEIPEDRSGREQDETAMEMFVRAIPPEEQDWITKSATLVSQTISATTNLLLTTVTAASSYYISHSSPSPHHPSSPAPAGGPPPLPPRALVFLTSEKTRQNLSNVHAVSSKAVHVSSKTVSAIDNMIRRAVGSKPKTSRNPSHTGGHLSPSPDPARAPSPSYLGPSFAPPPAYSDSPNGYGNDKPSLPPRGPSPLGGPPPIPPRTGQGPPPGIPQQQEVPRLKLSTKARILFSADLILSTIDASTRRALDVGTNTVGNVVEHKYGSEAAQSTRLLAGTARNVGLVYVDMSGIGRRALLKRAGKQYVRSKISSGNTPHLQDYQPQYQHPQPQYQPQPQPQWHDRPQPQPFQPQYQAQGPPQPQGSYQTHPQYQQQAPYQPYHPHQYQPQPPYPPQADWK